ncbi:MAG TPA: hypothetical protein VGS20_08965 [Candidatus Acidoferrales bacterium]|nr:hypothetical protein [Candidatus Acidoferrales bacterium]
MAIGSVEYLLATESSGTSLTPGSTMMDMIRLHRGGWETMVMAEGFLADTQQSGPRGADKLFSTNWSMFRANHHLAGGIVTLRAMLSLEPATVTDRRYPALFATGETAFGRPILDGQHPHNFLMELAAEYTHPLGAHSAVTLYGGPVGDVPLGPAAYPHRISSTEFEFLPVVGHHWEDATHISRSVVTGAISYRWFRVELGGFNGQEPNENRWNLPVPGIDSWAARLSIVPSRDWVAQASIGSLSHPEATSPADVVRSTVSVTYNRLFPSGWWASSAIWGRNHFTAPSARNRDAYLAESTLHLENGSDFFGRFERVSNDELLDQATSIAQALAQPPGTAFWVNAATAGYAHEIPSLPFLRASLGGAFEFYAIPQPLQQVYGRHPVGGQIFLRLWARRPHAPPMPAAMKM